MEERELLDEDVNWEATEEEEGEESEGGSLPEPVSDEAQTEAGDDQARAGGMVDLQLEREFHSHDDHDHEDEDHTEGKGKGKGKVHLSSVRFSDDATLIKVARNKKVLEKGATGDHITKIQQALAELGHLDVADVTGTIDDKTVAAIKAFQTAKGLSDDGEVGKDTMRALDGAFGDYSVEAKRAMGKTPSTLPTKGTQYPVGSAPKELLEGTDKPTAGERTAFDKAISTEQVADASGKLPKFKKKKAKEYERKLEKLVDSLIDNQLKWAKEMDTARTAGFVYDWGDVDKVAIESQKATDAVFGKYAVGNPLTATGIAPNIKDAWKNKEDELAADASVADGWAWWRVEKLITGNREVRKLDKKYGAIQSRPREAAIVDRVHTKLEASRRDDLILIHKAWPGYADEGEVFIQRIQKRDSAGNVDKAEGRNFMWDTFQTLIHEYIHTLEHDEHVAYRQGKTEQQGDKTLREGVTDYFTKIAYNATPITPALRKAVEGPFHETAVVHDIPPLGTYDEAINAERAAAIVGFDNMAAAFFLGEVELIGKT